MSNSQTQSIPGPHVSLAARPQPRKVLQVINSVDIGGAEKRLLDVSRAADERVDLHFALLSGEVGRLGHEFRSAGATLHELPLDLYFPFRFKQLLARHRFDVVHAHMHFSAGLIIRLASHWGVPTRMAHFRSCHDGKRKSWRRSVQHRILRGWISKYATHVLTCGETVMRKNWGELASRDARFRVIHNGLDSSPFRIPRDRETVAAEFGFDAESPLIIHVGNLRPPKNHAKLLSVFQQMVGLLPTANLVLVGRGENSIEASLSEFARQHQISDRVVFAGLRDDVPRLMHAADLMIFPSLWEGLPGAVLEACAAGLPVLGSDIDEVREIAEHFSSVQCESLSTADEQWAQRAAEIINQRSGCNPVIQTTNAFDQSPYEIQNCVEALYQVWGCEAPVNRSLARAV